MYIRATAFATLMAAAGLLSSAYAAPEGKTAQCKDGSYTSADEKRGACSGHGGVKDWYGKEAARSAKNEKRDSMPPEGSTGRCDDGSYTSADRKSGACSGHGGVKDWFGKEKAAEADAKSSAAGGSSARNTSRADSGRPGQVWVNSESHVYHCSGDRWYGKTTKGEYMSEADAKARGNHADHGKSCS